MTWESNPKAMQTMIEEAMQKPNHGIVSLRDP